MRAYAAVVERGPEIGVFAGYVPGFPGARSQGDSLDELHATLRHVIAMLLEDSEPALEPEFVGTQTILVAGSDGTGEVRIRGPKIVAS
jgi:predicted RNase H-like HicB family nuclease